MLRNRSLRLAVAAALTLWLAGCGGDDTTIGSSGNGGAVANSAEQPTGQSTGQSGGQPSGANAFLAQVLALIGTSSETAEPAPVDSTPAATSETAEPEPVS